MASKVLLCVLLCTAVVSQDSPQIINVTVGESVMIPCSLNIDNKTPIDPKTFYFYWQEELKTMFFWDKGEEKDNDVIYRGRVRAFNSEFKSGNLSIILDNVTPEDDQKIIWVNAGIGTTNYFPIICKSTLQVEAPYQEPVLTVNDTENSVMCTTHGGFPEPQVSWTGWTTSNTTISNLQVVTNIKKDPVKKTYTVTSTVNVTDLHSVTCDVYNPRSQKRINKTFILPQAPGENNLDIIIGGVVGGLLSFAIGFGLGYFLDRGERCDRNHRQPAVRYDPTAQGEPDVDIPLNAR